MATIQQLISCLEQGLTLKSVAGETFTPAQSGMIEFQRHEARSRYFWPRESSIAEIRTMRSNQVWGVVFVDASTKKEYLLTDLAAIEEAIKENRPRYVYGKLLQ